MSVCIRNRYVFRLPASIATKLYTRTDYLLGKVRKPISFSKTYRKSRFRKPILVDHLSTATRKIDELRHA